MELKVWVDGIQRVVCGVTDDTTCHDVIIALANAIGRTGRFTLIEKWRDSERPLPQNEFPARALQKWGEYASEVRLLLCQSDDKKRTHKEKEHLQKTDKISNTLTHPEQQVTGDPPLKRSSTFSGAHNVNPGPRTHRDQLSSRLNPISENQHSGGFQPYVKNTLAVPHPIPSPRRKLSPNRTSSPIRLPSSNNIVSHSPVNSVHNVVRPLPNRPSHYHNNRDKSPSHLHMYSNHDHLGPPNIRGDRSVYPKRDIQSRDRRSPNTRKDHSNIDHSFVPKSPSNRKKELLSVEHTFDSNPSHSRSASLEIEEYDLDRNFPDILRDSSRHERPSIHTEYKLEEDVKYAPESEHAKLLRLVTVQLERIKTQESQIDMVDTEICSLEEKEREYEESLEQISTELLKLEQKQKEDEPDLIKLESVSWDVELSKANKLELDLLSQIKELKNKRDSCELKLSDMKHQEKELNQNINNIKEEISSAEKKLQVEEDGLKSEVKKLNSELTQKQCDCDKLQKDLDKLDLEIKDLEQTLTDKHKEIDQIEEELKEENMKSLDDPVTLTVKDTVKDTVKKDNGEAILKILEGRLSPNPNSKLKTPQAFINSLTTQNPNGVWV